MSHQELISSNMKNDLTQDIQNIDLSGCSNNELIALRSWCLRVKEQADIRTLEDEVVGYTYHNLSALNPILVKEEKKRGMRLVKSLQH